MHLKVGGEDGLEKPGAILNGSAAPCSREAHRTRRPAADTMTAPAARAGINFDNYATFVPFSRSVHTTERSQRQG